MAKQSAYKSVTAEMTVSAALSSAFGVAEELAEEMEETAGNFPNPDHPKAQAFEEAGSTLRDSCEAPEDPKPPEGLLDPFSTVIKVTSSVPRDKRRQPGRAVRLSDAEGTANAAVEELRGWVETMRDKEGGEEKHPEDVESYLDELEAYCDEVEHLVGEWSGVEFPGMFG